MEDRFRQEQGFESVVGGLTGGGPIPRQVYLGEVYEGSGNVGVIGDETSIEIGKAKEGSDVFHLFGGGPTGNTIQFDGVHGELSRFDNHSEIFHLSRGKTTFLQFEMEVQFCHSLKDVFGTFTMGFFVRGEDKEVIHIDDKPSFCDHVSEGVIHEPLEHC